MLSLRSRHALGAVAVAVLLGAGCSSQAEGHPEFAGTLSTPTDLPTGGGIDGPTDSPSASDSLSASDSPSGSVSSGGLSPEETADKICASISPGELKQILGGTAEAKPGLAYQCRFTGERASVLVYEFPTSTLAEVMGESSNPRPRTIAGHPAIVDAKSVSIAESDSPQAPGILRGMILSGKPATTIALLQKVIKTFER